LGVGIIGVLLRIGGLIIATGPTTGVDTNVTTGAAGAAAAPLGPITKGFGRTVPTSKRTAIVLGVGSDPTPQPAIAKQRINPIRFILAFQNGR